MDDAFSKQVVLEAFLPQYYLSQQHPIPPSIIYQGDPIPSLTSAFEEQGNRSCFISNSPRGVKRKWCALAEKNALVALNAKLQASTKYQERLSDLQRCLGMESSIKRIECFDISHTQGDVTVASCVVFNDEGPQNQAYRKFNISGITPGDDYAAMAQVLKRRYKRGPEDESLPQLLLIDGGKGQVNIANKVLDTLELSDLPILGIAKGPSRKAGWETLLLAREEIEFTLEEDRLAFHLLQHIRDEAHRFAISAHRKKRESKGLRSVLEDIDGVGQKRRTALLKYFGGIQALKRATVEQIAQVPGISQALANKIFEQLSR